MAKKSSAGDESPTLSYREAWAALHNFASSFAAPIVTLLPMLEKAKDAEEFVTSLQPQIDEKTSELADRVKAIEQAKVDRDAVLNSIEHEREVRLADMNRYLEAQQARVNTKVDELAAQLSAKYQTVGDELAALDRQLEDRREEQRALDVAINQKRVTLAELTGKLHRIAEGIG